MSKKHLRIFAGIISLFVFCQKSSKEMPWLDGFPKNFAAHDKVIMVDFFDEGCAPCMRLLGETFTDPKVVDFCQKDLATYKIHAWWEANEPIREANKVYSIPTLIFFNQNGEEIERLVGFRDAETFIREVTDIIGGKGTYLSLKKQYEAEPDDMEVLYQLALKESKIGRKGDANSHALWKKLMENSEPGSSKEMEAELHYKTGILWAEEQPEGLIDFMQKIDNPACMLDALHSLTDYYNYKKDTTLEIQYTQQYTDYIMQHPETMDTLKTISAMNGYAWRMTELSQNLNDALVKIDYAVSLFPADIDVHFKVAVVDTKAEVHWKLGDKETALKLTDECLKETPDDEYLINKRKAILGEE